MALRTTVGSLLINEVLPEEMRQYDRVFDVKTTTALLSEIANKYPDQYRGILKRLGDLGREFAYFSGGQSVSVDDLRTAVAAKQIRYELSNALQKIIRSNLSDADKDRKIIETVGKYQARMREEVLKESVAEDNPLGRQVIGTGRGSAFNLSSLRGSDLMYTDHRGEVVPIPILRNYSEGLTPLEYFTGAFGARKGLFDLALATQQAGSFSKQLVQAAHRLLVSARDDDQPYDESRPIGYELSTDDPDNEGAYLAHPVGGYPRNTELTPKILKDLRSKGIEKILVRSPMVGGPSDGGVYAFDVGRRERGVLAPVGDFVGISAAQGLCLAGDTLVRMADYSTKPISEICAGEYVLGCDLEGRVRPVEVLAASPSGYRPCIQTLFCYRDGAEQRIVELVATAQHHVLAAIVGDDGTITPMAVQEIHRPPTGYYFAAVIYVADDKPDSAKEHGYLVDRMPAGEQLTYDLYIDHPDHLFVLANGLIVSNSEPVTQGAISSKHAGGVAGATASASVSGFKGLSNIVQIPKHFPGGAAHAQVDGLVTDITAAPQGGYYVTINGHKHYVGHGFHLKVKRGDTVEAGDMISDGMPNPAEIVKHKGIGDGRVYFVQAFRNALESMGTPGHRRNIELLARGLINHVRLSEEVGDYVPDDVMPYHVLEKQWKPRPGHTATAPKQALGRYLEVPVLHYTIGTKVRPSMLPYFERYNIKSVVTHADPPPWQPEMIRAMENVSHDPDFMTRMLGAYQQRSILRAAHRGDVSDETGTSYVPALARGELFGRAGKTKGIASEIMRKY